MANSICKKLGYDNKLAKYSLSDEKKRGKFLIIYLNSMKHCCEM